MADGVYKCHDCHMNFGTINLLQKHKAKFCVGSVGDPESLWLRKGLRSSFGDESPRPISPDERDYQRYNPNQDAQLRQLAENHGRQMEYLQLKNRDLEKQKEDIRRRLLELGTKGRPTGDNTSELLAELRAQEDRNARALEDLKRHLYDINHQRVNVIEYERQALPQPAPPPPVETGRKSYVYPVYYGNSLVAEISAIRQAYLQNGGNDPDVLAQMAQMQAEAQNIEDSMKKGGYDNRHREKKGANQLQQLMLENDRLHRELLLIQEQNSLARDRRKSDREGRDPKHYPIHDAKFDRHPLHDESDKLEQFVSKYGQYGDSILSRQTNRSKQSEQVDRLETFEQKFLRYNQLDPLKHQKRDKGALDFRNTDFPKEKAEKPHPQQKPYVPPLDLRGVNDDGNQHHQSRDKNYERKHHSPQQKSHQLEKLNWDKYKSQQVKGQHDIHQYVVQNDYHRHLKRSNTDYVSRSRKQSGSHKSIRSEVIDGVFDPRQGRKFQLLKGSNSETDLVELYKSSKGRDRRKQSDSRLLPYEKDPKLKYSVKTMYSVPADRKYETVSIQHRDEMNPNTQNVISTVTYKEQRMREKVKV